MRLDSGIELTCLVYRSKQFKQVIYFWLLSGLFKNHCHNNYNEVLKYQENKNYFPSQTLLIQRNHNYYACKYKMFYQGNKNNYQFSELRVLYNSMSWNIKIITF